MAKKKKICIDKDEMINEHERIVQLLRDPKPKELKEELEEQSKELKDYKEASEKFVEVTIGGNQQIVEGKEPLKKDPKLMEKWKSIKKSLNNVTSIMDIADEIRDEEQHEAPQVPEQQPQDQEQSKEQQPEQSLQPEEAMQEEQPQQSPEELEQLIEQALRDDGYSESEIAYILRGHHIDIDAMPSKEDEKDLLDIEHNKNIMSHDSEHHKRSLDHDYEHKKRMSDLEYEFARQQKQAALDHLKQQYEYKIQAMKDSINKKAASKIGDDNE